MIDTLLKKSRHGPCSHAACTRGRRSTNHGITCDNVFWEMLLKKRFDLASLWKIGFALKYEGQVGVNYVTKRWTNMLG